MSSPGKLAWHEITALAQPIVGHLSSDPAETIALLQRAIPSLGSTDQAVRFFRAMLRLTPPGPEKQIARHRWFLSALPRRRQVPETLGELLDYCRKTKQADPAGVVEAIIADCKVPHAARYAYRRSFTHTAHAFLRDWQVIGPFPNPASTGHDTAYGPELQPIDLAAHHEAFEKALGFRLLKSAGDYVDLGSALAATPGEGAVAYAVCWVHCPRGRAAAMEASANDGCKAWVNRRLVHAHRNPRRARPGRHVSRFYLRRGWNEILLKVSHTGDKWGFFIELVDHEGRGPLTDIKASTRPE